MKKTQRWIDDLDDLDTAILAALSSEPDSSVKAVAARVEIAESTCAYRLRRMRESGLIRPSRLEVDHARLGYALKAIIIVFLARHSREVVDRFMNHVVALPNVLNVMNLTGRYDFMVTVAVENTEELKSFVLDRITTLPSVRGTETHIVFDMRDGSWIPEPAYSR